MEMPDAGTVERWLADPELRDVAVASLISAIAMYRASDVKTKIGKFTALLGHRLEGKSIYEAWEQDWKAQKDYDHLMFHYRMELSTFKQWRSLNAGIGERPLPIYILSAAQWFVGDFSLLNDAQKQAASIAYAEYVAGQNELIPHRIKLIARWDEIKRHEKDIEPVEPIAPLGVIKAPDAQEVMLIGAVAFYIGLHPQVVPETLKGIGEIIKGIGEIIPF